MSSLFDLAERLKNKLGGLEIEALTSIGILYQQFLTDFKLEFELLISQILSIKSRGGIVTESLLYKTTRLANTINQLDRLLDEFNNQVVSSVLSKQKTAVSFGVSDVNELLKNSLQKLPDEVFDYFSRVSPSFVFFDERAVVEMTRRLVKGEPLSNILIANNAHAIDDLTKKFLGSIIKGINTRDAAAQMYQDLGLSLWRAETLARTEIVGTYREVNLQRMKESKVVKKWRWSATLDERVCPVCIFLDGKLFDFDEVFATHPNCRCAAIPITLTFRELGLDMDDYEASYRESGEEWFNGKSSKFQDRILGPLKGKLFRSGQLTLGDLVGEKEHPTYGPVRYEKSVKQLKQQGALHN